MSNTEKSFCLTAKFYIIAQKYFDETNKKTIEEKKSLKREKKKNAEQKTQKKDAGIKIVIVTMARLKFSIVLLEWIMQTFFFAANKHNKNSTLIRKSSKIEPSLESKIVFNFNDTTLGFYHFVRPGKIEWHGFWWCFDL